MSSVASATAVLILPAPFITARLTATLSPLCRVRRLRERGVFLVWLDMLAPSGKWEGHRSPGHGQLTIRATVFFRWQKSGPLSDLRTSCAEREQSATPK